MEALRPVKTELGSLPYLVYTTLIDGPRDVDRVIEPNVNESDTLRVWYDVIHAGGSPQLLSRAGNASVDPLHRANEREATFIYDRRVYKWFEDPQRAFNRYVRAITSLRDLVPPNERHVGQWLSYAYEPGYTLAEVVDGPNGASRLVRFLDWANANLWLNLTSKPGWAVAFYRDKTLRRLKAIPGRAEPAVLDAVTRLPWDRIADECRVTRTWHGDCSFENVVLSTADRLDRTTLLDWREDLMGDPYWDLAKLLKSAHFDHRKIDESGELRGHDHEAELQATIVKWCVRHGYDLKKLWLAYALHWFAMSGRYDGPLGVNLYERGKADFAMYLSM